MQNLLLPHPLLHQNPMPLLPGLLPLYFPLSLFGGFPPGMLLLKVLPVIVQPLQQTLFPDFLWNLLSFFPAPQKSSQCLQLLSPLSLKLPPLLPLFRILPEILLQSLP